jgi:5-methylcytosine-specific restriction endonuclease McrA
VNRAAQWVKDAWRNKTLTHSLRSKDWPRARGEWLQDHPACAACGSVFQVEVHHKIPFHLHPELELDPGNFISLCEISAHGNHHLHLGHLGNWKGFNSNVVRDAQNTFEWLSTHLSKAGPG